MTERGKRRTRRALGVVGVLGAGLIAFYLWQPQKLNLFMSDVPSLRLVDPDSARLFSPGARVALVVGHPDDPEFFLGGTLTKLHRAGAKVLVVCLTDGDKAYYPPGFTNPEENRRVRRAEQTRASKRYGAEVRFVGEPDGRLADDDRVLGELRAVLSEWRPEWVLGFDPVYWPRVQHRDHLAAGRLVGPALENLPSVKWHLMFATRAPQFAVDTSRLWDEKRLLIAEHRSQFGGKADFINRMVRGRDRSAGAMFGVGLAEPFRVEER